MKRSFIKIFTSAVLALITVFLMFATACASEKPSYPDMPEAVFKVRDNTFVLNCAETNQTATGFVYTYHEGYPIALTNYHTLAKNTAPYAALSAQAVFGDGSACGVELMGWNEYHDIAVLKLDCDYEFYDFAAENAFSLPENDDFVCSVGNEHGKGALVHSHGEWKESDSVVYTGFLGRYSLVSSATESAYKYVPVHTISCSVEEGMSGCPISDENGNILGVGTYRDSARLNKNYYAVPITIALAVADRVLENHAAGKAAGEVMLFGDGMYSAFLTSEDGELAVLGNYYREAQGMTVLADDGFTCIYDSELNGLRVTRIGTDCVLSINDVITAIDGRPVYGGTDFLTLLYGSYEYNGSGEAAVLSLSDGRTAVHKGITAKS